MVSPERRAWSRAAASDFCDGSIPVTVAPSAASVSARMPPPHPTSRTRLDPNPPNTRRKYSTRTAFSSCSPANGPASLHHTPGTRSTRRSYFSGSERPPRRGSWSDMAMKSTAGRRVVEDGGGGTSLTRGESLHRNQPPPPFTTSTNLPQPPSGGSLHIRERRHIEKPQPREPRVLVHLDEQQVGDTHDGGGALASYADVEHRLIRVFLHRERGVHLHGRDSWLRLAAGEHDASVLGGLRDRKGVARADVVRPRDDVHAVDATAGHVDDDERAVAAFQVHRPVETGRLPGAFARDGEDVGLRIPAIAHLGQLARERLDPCFELHREPAFQPPRRAGNIGRTLRRS